MELDGYQTAIVDDGGAGFLRVILRGFSGPGQLGKRDRGGDGSRFVEHRVGDRAGGAFRSVILNRRA